MNFLKDNNYRHDQIIAVPAEIVFINYAELKKLRARHDEISKMNLELLTVVVEKRGSLYNVVDNFEMYYKRTWIQAVKTLHVVVGDSK
jgi:hypothetical protein